MWKYIIIAYIILAIITYILISVGVSILISQRYMYLPEEFWPKPKVWHTLGISIIWPITLLVVVLDPVINYIKSKLNKED